MGEFFHHRMCLGVNVNRPLEIVAEEHWLDRKVPNDDRRNRQQNKRQSNNPRRLMRFLPRLETVMLVYIVGATVVIIATMFRMGVVMGAVSMCFAETLFTVEDQEVHTERIESRDEHADHDGKIRETGACDV